MRTHINTRAHMLQIALFLNTPNTPLYSLNLRLQPGIFEDDTVMIPCYQIHAHTGTHDRHLHAHRDTHFDGQQIRQMPQSTSNFT
jgi:hypothetical protein